MKGQTFDCGVFTFSLDFELAWGTRGRPKARWMKPFLDGTRAAVADLLGLLEQYEISATWAVVGALLLGSRTSRHPWLEESQFDDVPLGDAAAQPHWYAEDVLEEILGCSVVQEIGCHTLRHMYVDPTPAGRQPFRDELSRFLELFDQLLLPRPQSFIYPKGIMGHLDVLSEMGFRCFRGPENGWFESLPGVLAPAAMRLVDAKLARPPRVEQPQRRPEGVWMIPASQFYSPFMSVGKHVSVDARVRKAIKGLHKAAKHGGVFHLWTHPANLGCHTEHLLAGLNRIFGEARRLCDAEQLKIMSMGQLASLLDHPSPEPTVV
jgi:hypothetical protein